jgi:CTP:molybdopterin cytidylyltransferase MocA
MICDGPWFCRTSVSSVGTLLCSRGIVSASSHVGQQQGVNALVDRHAQHAVPFSSTQLIDDIDTLDEYQRLLDEESHLPS